MAYIQRELLVAKYHLSQACPAGFVANQSMCDEQPFDQSLDQSVSEDALRAKWSIVVPHTCSSMAVISGRFSRRDNDDVTTESRVRFAVSRLLLASRRRSSG